jgi:hypothetical protein
MTPTGMRSGGASIAEISHRVDDGERNRRMVERIEATPVRYPVRFVIAGDSGAWFDPTADAIFAALISQIAVLDPPPLFFANLGDFAGPGTLDRHRHYLGLVEPLPCPDLCVIGNHELDDALGFETFAHVHGAPNFSFAYGDTRFVAIDGTPGVVGEITIEEPSHGVEGPREEALEFLDRTLATANEPHRIVFTHMPPYMNGRYAPHENWGFRPREREFFDLLHQHGVKLVCSAHGLAFDHHVHEGVRVVMSGGGGSGLCSHLRGVCSEGPGYPEDRGALFHVVEITIAADGGITGRVIQAFDRAHAADRYFGVSLPADAAKPRLPE